MADFSDISRLNIPTLARLLGKGEAREGSTKRVLVSEVRNSLGTSTELFRLSLLPQEEAREDP